MAVAVGFLEGAARISLKDERLCAGVRVAELDLEVLDVDFPLDLADGPARFQRSRTRVRKLVLDVELDALTAWLRRAVAKAGGTLFDLRLTTERGTIVAEGQYLHRGVSIPFAAGMALVPDAVFGLRIVVEPPMWFGLAPPIPGLARAFAELSEQLLTPLAGGTGPTRVGVSDFSVDVMTPAVWALLPARGYKLPQMTELPVAGINVHPDGLKIYFSFESQIDDEADGQVMAILGRADSAEPVAGILEPLSTGDTTRAFHALRAGLDGDAGPEGLAAYTLALGTADPKLHAETADLAFDILDRGQAKAPAHLALAVIDAAQGRRDSALSRATAAAELFEAAGRHRAAGIGYWTAARYVADDPDQKAQVLARALRLAPHSAVILPTAVQIFARVGRPEEAVRRAFELAELAAEPAEKAAALTEAGSLLVRGLLDPVRAKRAFEQALSLVPDHPDALEGLAAAVAETGDPRRSTAILERLFTTAESQGDRRRAARFAVALGDVFRGHDPSAAARRYHEAHRLDGKNLHALERVAIASFDQKQLSDGISKFDALLQLQLEPSEARRLRCVAAHRCLEADRAQDVIRYLVVPDLERNAEVLEPLASAYENLGNVHKLDEVLGELVAVALTMDDLSRATDFLKRRIVVRHEAGFELGVLQDAIRAVVQGAGQTWQVVELEITLCELTRDHERLNAILEEQLGRTDDAERRAQIFEKRAEALIALGREADALVCHEELLRLEADRPASLEILRQAYRRMGCPERLAPRLEAAAHATADSESKTAYLLERARVLADIGHGDRALNETSEGDDQQMLSMSTTLALELGRWEEARMLSEKRRRLGGTPRECLSVELDIAQACSALNDERGEVVALNRALDAADALEDSERWHVLAKRLATTLKASGRFEELADLCRRISVRPGISEDTRFELLLSATEAWLKVDQTARARADLETLVGLLRSGFTATQAALEAVERCARRVGDAALSAEVLGVRGEAATDANDKRSFLISKIEVLAEARLFDLLGTELESLEPSHLPQLPEALERFGQIATQSGRLSLAAELYMHGAQLATGATARELHRKSGEALAEIGRLPEATEQRRRVVELSNDDDPTAHALVQALEVQARSAEDEELLDWALLKKSESTATSDAAGAFVELAKRRAALGETHRAVGLLRKALERAPDSRVTQDFYLELLRAHGRRTSLMAALESIAARRPPTEAARLELEAADLVVASGGDDHTNLRRALSILERAADRAADGGDVPVGLFQRMALYARRAGLPAIRLRGLDALIAAVEEPVRQLAYRIERVDVWMHGGAAPRPGPTALIALADEVEELGPEASRRLADDLEGIELEIAIDVDQVARSLRLLALDLTEDEGLWDEHVGVLESLIERTSNRRARAQLYVALGEVEEGRRHDFVRAERNYLAALAADDEVGEARSALSRLYLASGRFDELGDSVGVDVLTTHFEALLEGPDLATMIRAGTALWPRLPVGSVDRAEVLYRLGETHRHLGHADLAQRSFEQIVADGDGPLQHEALEALVQLAIDRGDQAALIHLRIQQAAREADPETSAAQYVLAAEMIVESDGDLAEAEQYYRAAIDLDSANTEASRRLATLLCQQGRYDDILRVCGRAAFLLEAHALIEDGEIEASRLALASLGSELRDQDIGALWAHIADSSCDLRERHRAFELAAAREGPHLEALLESFEAFLLEQGDTKGSADILRRRIHLAPTAEGKRMLRSRLVEQLGKMVMQPSPVPVTSRDAPPRPETEEALTRMRSSFETPPEIERLATRLLAGPDPLAAAGPLLVARQFAPNRALPLRPPPMVVKALNDRLLLEHLAEPGLATPLGRMLLTTAMPIARSDALKSTLTDFATIPFVSGEDLLDEEVEETIRSVSTVVDLGLDVHLAPDLGVPAAVRPGETMSVLVDPDRASALTSTELRFQLGRALMLVRLGMLPVLLGGGDLVALRAVLAPLLAPHADGATSTEKRFGPRALAAMQVMAQSGKSRDLDLESWADAARRTADRFGVLLCGDLAAARLDGSALDDIVAFLLSDDYTEVLRGLAAHT